MKSFGPFRLDPVNHCLWHHDQRAPLTPKAFDVLRYLVEQAPRLVTQEELLDALWPGTYVNPEGIRKYILEIRKRLGDPSDQPVFIATIPKRGYQFVAEVVEERETGPAFPPPVNVVGRQYVLTRLHECFRAACSGRRQLVFVTGEPGIGKTTIVDSFRHQIEGRQIRIARGQCIEGFGGLEAYYPMLEAIGGLLRDTADASLIQILASRAPAWLVQFPGLLKPEQRDSIQREILGSTRERMVREISEAMERMAAEIPLVIILEDLHWADASTLDLISAFARRREAAKVLLLGTYRPVDVVLSQSPLKALKGDLLVRHLCHEIPLEPLGEFDVAGYLASTFSTDRIPDGLAGLIHHNSGGNPLFMSTIVQEIGTRGLIAMQQGSLVLTAPLQEIYPGIPETLQHVLETQLEQLSKEDLRILQAASVTGERFSLWAVEALIQAADVEEACDRLAARQQFIRSLGIQPSPHGAGSPHFEFRHSLYRQALYGGLAPGSRSDLHHALAERLFPICMGARPDLASEVAMHYEQGRDYHHAARCLITAANNAANRFAHRESIEILRRGLGLLGCQAPGTHPDLEIEILQHMGDTHYALGEMSESAACYGDAANRASGAGLDAAHAAALIRLGFSAWYLDPERGRELSRQALEFASKLNHPLLSAQTRLAFAGFRLLYDAWSEADVRVGAEAWKMIAELSGSTIVPDVYTIYVLALQGNYEEAHRQADAMIYATTNPTVYVLARGGKGLAHLMQGRYGDLLQLMRTGREAAARNGEAAWMYLFGEAWLRLQCGDFHGVTSLSEIPIRSDAGPHSAWMRAASGIARGYIELRLENRRAALECFENVRSTQVTTAFFLHWYWRLQATIGIVETFLTAGDLEAAQHESEILLQTALTTAEPNLRASAYELRARVALGMQDTKTAAGCIQDAMAILDQFDLPCAAWRVYSTAWDLWHEEHHRAKAHEAILRLADSFPPGEPLREHLLSMLAVKKVLARGA